jgi:CHAT domain-containing protein
MKKMYDLIKAGRGKAEALREAQLWLKNPDNTQEHQDMLPDWCNDKADKDKKTLLDRHRFSVESNEPETFLPTDLSRPYYWAGFICSGAA